MLNILKLLSGSS